MSKPYRVIVWGPGSVGTQLLHLLHERPEFEVAGVLGYSKAGVDVGEYLGHGATGVTISADKAAVFALDADVVVIAARGPDCSDDDVIALLQSGKNVIASGAYFYPPFGDADRAKRLADACAAGKSTLHGAGEFPGMFLDRIALTLTGLTAQVDTLVMEEFANLDGNGSLKQWEKIGVNGPVEKAAQIAPIAAQRAFFPAYSEAIALVALALFGTLPEVDLDVAYGVAEADFAVDGGTIAKGMVDRLTFTYTAAIDGQVRLTVIVHWGFAGKDKWIIDFKGDPISMRSEFHPEPTPKRGAPAGGLTYPAYSDAVASVLSQSIPLVCAAEPGILYPSVFANAAQDLRVLAGRKSIAG